MAWVATFQGVTQNQQLLSVLVEYSDGVTTLRRTHQLSADATVQTLSAVARVVVRDLAAAPVSRSVIDGAFTVGDVIPSGAVTPPAPTQEQLDRQAFLDALRTHRQYQQAVTDGLMLATDSDVVAARAAAVALWNARWVAYL